MKRRGGRTVLYILRSRSKGYRRKKRSIRGVIDLVLVIIINGEQLLVSFCAWVVRVVWDGWHHFRCFLGFILLLAPSHFTVLCPRVLLHILYMIRLLSQNSFVCFALLPFSPLFHHEQQ